MSAPVILCVAAVYAFVAFDQARKGEVGMAMAWLGYSFANIGLAMAAK